MIKMRMRIEKKFSTLSFGLAATAEGSAVADSPLKIGGGKAVKSLKFKDFVAAAANEKFDDKDKKENRKFILIYIIAFLDGCRHVVVVVVHFMSGFPVKGDNLLSV